MRLPGHRFDENKETGGWLDKDGWGFDLTLTLSKMQHKFPKAVCLGPGRVSARRTTSEFLLAYPMCA